MCISQKHELQAADISIHYILISQYKHASMERHRDEVRWNLENAGAQMKSCLIQARAEKRRKAYHSPHNKERG